MDKFTYIKSLFEAHADADNAQSMAKYMRNQFIFYGIKTPTRKALYKDFVKSEKKIGIIDWAFLDQCYADDHREFQYLVYDYLKALQKTLTFEDIPKLRTDIQTKSLWDTIDIFDTIIGTIGLTDNRVNQLMLNWSKDPDFWIRRIAIDHQLGRKEKTNTALLEAILINNLGSSDFFINKAIGWSLRDYSKTNPNWVRDFIHLHKKQMAAISIREGSKYL